MYYLLALFQSVLAAVNMIVGQKVLEKRSVGNNWQTALSRIIHIFILAILAFFGVFEPALNAIDTKFYGGLFLLSLAILYVTYPLRRTAYLNEKISVLQPFALMRQIFAVLFAIALLSENVSTITLGVTLLAVGVLIASNIEHRRIVLNRYSGMILLSSLLQAAGLVIVVKLVALLGPMNFYFIESFGILAIAGAMIVAKKEGREILTVKRDYFSLQILANTLALVSIVCALVLYGQIGVTMTSLFSLLYLVFLMGLGIVFLSDIPTRKNVITTVLIAFCVGIWVVFRHAA